VRGAETAVAARLVRERESDTVAESPKEEEDTAPWWWEGKAAVETAMPWTASSAIGGGTEQCVGLVWIWEVREMTDWMG
jgi:hypothetical protein